MGRFVIIGYTKEDESEECIEHSTLEDARKEVEGYKASPYMAAFVKYYIMDMDTETFYE